jgi:O-antigen/teichoic acid export membrane protein
MVGCADLWRLTPYGRIHWNWDLLAAQFTYSWPMWTTAVVGVVNAQFDKMVVSHFFAPEVYAVYSVGAQELPVVGLFTASLATAMLPNLVVLAGRGQMGAALLLWQAATRKSALVMFPCFVFFAAVSGDLMVLLYGPSYVLAGWPFAVYLGVLPVRVAVYASMFRAMGRTKPVAIGAVIALVVNAVVSPGLCWLGRGGMLAFVGPALGAWASTVSAALYLLFALGGATGRGLAGTLPWKDLARTLLGCLPAGLATLALGFLPLPLAVRLAAQAGAFALVMLAMFQWTPILHADERAMVAEVFGMRKRPE